MAAEILSVPEEYLLEVIAVIRSGLAQLSTVSDVTREQLTRWCDAEEVYMLGDAL